MDLAANTEVALIDQLFDPTFWTDIGGQLVTFVSQKVLAQETLIELALVAAIALVAWRVSRPLGQRFLARADAQVRFTMLGRLWRTLSANTFPLVWLVLQVPLLVAAPYIGLRPETLTLTTNLLAAWVVINLATVVVANPGWARFIAVVAWTVAALNIVGYLDGLLALLDGTAITLGSLNFSVLTVLQALVTLTVLFWGARIASQYAEARLKSAQNMSPSMQVLASKFISIGLIVVAVVASLSVVGIDLTALTVFGGAIGVGLGFGLQKIFANLVSGFILLMEKSIKPGDVIEVANYYGRVESLGARYVSVYTRDGIEHLIPNEDLIVNRVENWSYSQNLLRLRKTVGVHYKADVHKAIQLCLEAAAETPRILGEPKPVCLMKEFGESSVDLEIRYWINDPMNGRANVTSEMLIKVWDKFHEHDIEIPYPQRDLHLRSSDISLSGDHD